MKVEKLSTTMRQMWKAWIITAISKEIREAELTGEGAKMRECHPHFPKKTMYYAVRLENGNVLRVSSNQASVLDAAPGSCFRLLGVQFLILMLLLSGVFASRLSGKVVEPLNGLDLETSG